jgi:2'-5' RNA ligase
VSASASAGSDRAERRLFFALWPDDAVRAAMRAAFGAAVSAAGGRAVPDGNLHLTLEFLGAVAARRCDALETLGAALSFAAGVVELDRLDYWPRARTLVAAPSAPPASLLALQAALRQELGGLGFRVDTRPFRPHVTLARAVDARPALTPPCVAWPLRELALVESLTAAGGSRYTPLARWRRGA